MRRTVFAKFLLACAPVAFLPALAHAQDADATDDAASTADAPQPANFGDIVVTAQRRSERLSEVPITISAQTSADLRRAGVTNLRELSIAVPGLTYSAQGPFAEPNIRGVATTLSGPGSDSPIAVYLDGIYLGNQVGNLFDLPDVDRIEVLKGPQGTLFGRNATGGAVSVYTRAPSNHFTGDFRVDDGLYFGKNVKTSNNFHGQGYLSGPISDTLAFSLSGYYNQTTGYLTDIVRNRRAGRIEGYGGTAKLQWTPSDDVKITLSAIYGRKMDNAGYATQPIGGLTVASQYADAIISDRPWHIASELNYAGKGGDAVLDTRMKGVSLRGEFNVADIGTLTSLTAYTYVNGYVDADVDGSYSPACVAAFACITPYSLVYGPSKSFQQELTFSSERMGMMSFVAGLFIYRDSAGYQARVNEPVDADGKVVGPPAFFSDALVTTQAYAGFGEVNWHFTDELLLITGIRYSWEQKKGIGSALGGPKFEFGKHPNWASWTPRLTLKYNLSNRANIYATYSKGFKSGVLNAVSLSDDTADPEKLTSYELGFKYGGPGINLSLAGFYYDYKELQVQFYQGLGNVIGNAASARIWGIDFDGSMKIGGGFDVRVAGAYLPHAKYRSFPTAIGFQGPMTPMGLEQVTVDASGTRILKSPKFSGNVTIGYNGEIGLGTLDASATVYHSSSYRWDVLGRFKTNAYTTIGGQIGLTPTDSNIRVGLYGKNLTNRAYVNATTISAQGDSGIYAPPREVGVSLGYKF